MKIGQLTTGEHLARIGGADLDVLRGVPTARPGFQKLGAMLLVTAAVAGVSMFFAAHDALGVFVLAAVVVGLLWAGVIYVLDSMLMAVGMGNSTASSVVLALVRVAIALVIGAVISTPLVMKVFSSDITYELGQMATATSKDNTKRLTASNEQAEVDRLTTEVRTLRLVQQGTLPGSLAPSASTAGAPASSTIESLRAELAAAEEASTEASTLYTCERYGNGREQLKSPGKCAAKPGPYGNAPRYLREAKAAAANVERIRSLLDAALKAQRSGEKKVLADLQKTAPAKLAEAEKDLAGAEVALTALTDRLREENNGNTGLLARLEALHKTGEENPQLRLAHLLIAALFVLIEVAPVFGKSLWSFNRRYREYEEALALKVAVAFDEDHYRSTRMLEVVKARIDADCVREEDMDKHWDAKARVVLIEQVEREAEAWARQIRATGVSPVTITQVPTPPAPIAPVPVATTPVVGQPVVAQPVVGTVVTP